MAFIAFMAGGFLVFLVASMAALAGVMVKNE